MAMQINKQSPKAQSTQELFIEYRGWLIGFTFEHNMKLSAEDISVEVFDIIEQKVILEYDRSGFVLIETEDNECIEAQWRMLDLDYGLMLRMAMWDANHNPSETLSLELFQEYFGSVTGEHFYGKWAGECKRDLCRMFRYFRSNRQQGQIFCNMLMSQVDKYSEHDS